MLAEAMRTNLTLSMTERQAVDMEWYEELREAKAAFENAQQMARDTAAEIKRETG